MLQSKITNGIKVSVQSKYDGKGSKPSQQRFIHAYFITIENLSDRTVKLISRHWTITASNGETREIEGEGVIGKQPLLKSFDTHSYNSWSPLSTPMGKMSGYYTFVDTATDEYFDVEVPEFRLIADFINN